MNQTEAGTGTGISGSMLFNNNGYMKMTVPTKTGFGGDIGHGRLTRCYEGGYENSTLTAVIPNHIEFTDNHV
jgi:hypothetical protein